MIWIIVGAAFVVGLIAGAAFIIWAAKLAAQVEGAIEAGTKGAVPCA